MDPITLVLLVMLGFVVLLVAGVGRRRRADSSSTDAARPPLLPRLVAGGAIVGALLSIVGGLIAIVSAFAAERLTLAVPVVAQIEVPPSELVATDARIESGYVSLADAQVTASGLDIETRVWFALGVLLSTVVMTTVLIVIARLAQQSIASVPFEARLHRLLLIAGGTLAIGSVLSQICLATAGSLAQTQLFSLVGEPSAGGAGFDIGLGPWVVELWPVGVGLVLIVAAGLIRNGERLQRDTTGLV